MLDKLPPRRELPGSDLSIKHGTPEVIPAPPAPAAAPAVPGQDVAAVGLPLQPVAGPGRHSQDHRLLQR